MGLRGIPETEIFLSNLELGADRLILPPEGYRSGFKRLMEAYNSQRTGAAAVALGIAQGALDHAVSFIKQRQQFGRPHRRVPGSAMDGRRGHHQAGSGKSAGLEGRGLGWHGRAASFPTR